MKHHIIIYGCQMNHSDAERVDGFFTLFGSKETSVFDEADVVVAIMCSVRQMAADHIFGLEQKIKLLRRKKSGFVAILTGCVVENDKSRFARFFDFILDIKTLPEWPDLLNFPARTRNQSARHKDYFHIAPKQSTKFSALIPISKGCDNYCTYCVVPYTRGPLKSRPMENILEEVNNAVNNGSKEIWLLGQNVNNYHWKNAGFGELLKSVNDIEGDFWVRFTSPHPKDFDDKTVNTMAKCQKVAPYLNLPIQSGDNTILKAMGRPYTVEAYKKLAAKIRGAFKKYRQGMEKQVAISTDVIVGFPGETNKQFLNTAKSFREVKFDMAYISRYSKRSGTAAAKLDDNVLPNEKKMREEKINEIIKKTALSHNKKYEGKIVEALINSIKKDTFALGKTRSYKTVKIKIGKNKINPGDIVKIKITKAMSFGLVGELSND